MAKNKILFGIISLALILGIVLLLGNKILTKSSLPQPVPLDDPRATYAISFVKDNVVTVMTFEFACHLNLL
jgi:hypothetical protein